MNSKKVLLIDDEADFMENVKNSLERHGFEVFSSTDGKDGIEKAVNIKPDIIFLDIMMSQMDGFTVLRRLREDCPGIADIPIIMFTGKRDSASIFESMEHKATDYIMKPCTTEELLAVLNKHLL